MADAQIIEEGRKVALGVAGLKASYEFMGMEEHSWDNEVARYGMDMHPHYKITVYAPRKGKATFDFWGSYHDYQQGKNWLSKYDLGSAVYMIIGDSLAGMMSFDEFVDEYGYDEPKSAYRIWQACKKTYAKLKKILNWSADNYYDFINELQEKYG